MAVYNFVHDEGPFVKNIVSVSLGSDARDHEATITVFGESVHLRRQGVNGHLEVAESLIRQLDGQVDAIGLGGIDRYLVVRGHRFEIQDGARLARAATSTPVVDGSGVKATLERRIVEALHRDGVIRPGNTVLMVSAMDRFGMAEAFYSLGYRLVAGDLIFASRINYPIRSIDELDELARKLLPEMTKLPFNQLYPVGDAQLSARDGRFSRYFDEADIIAGDFHYIRQYMPDRLDHKVVVTNTTTADDVTRLRQAGVSTLVTTTPVLNGRSFGANVIEAALVAVTGHQVGDPEWETLMAQSNLGGTRLSLNPEEESS
jgi:hypothetical protein